MLMLEKTVRLYKTQFDDMLMEIYGDHRLDRYSMDLDAILFRIKYMTKHNKDLDKIPALKKKFTETTIHMRECFGDFMFAFICKVITIPEPFKLDDLADLIAKDVKIDPNYVVFEMGILSENEAFLHFIDDKIDDDKPFNMFPDKYFRFYTDSYNDGIAKAYPELFENKQQNVIGTGDDADVFVHNFTIQSTEACSMNCTYCYQFNKMPTRMTLDTGKLLIDHLLNDDYGYINRYNSPAIILEFIGGEPLLEAKFTRAVYEYFLDRAYELNHPWFTRHRLSICSNGMQYFDEDVQSLFRDYSSQISFNVSIDGNKELHDACRRQPNGEGSYDISISALKHYNKYYSKERNSKMTLAPSNISYLFDSVKDFIEQGMTVININCVFEEGWNQKTARTEYEQLKKLADYILENNLEHIYIAIFNERQEDVLDYKSDSCFCGGSGAMLAMRPNGQFYPCIRYMPTSVGSEVQDLCIGDVHTGMVGRNENSPILKMLDNITRRSQNNDICYECPINNDCASCLALGHTVFGTPNKRTNFICIQMIAEALSNVYYWNALLLKHPEYDLKPRKNNVPDEWSLLVIDQDELDFLKTLELAATASYLDKRLNEEGA